MSAKSKTRRKDIRKKAKRTLKESKRAQYAAWKEAGQNKKSKRARKNARNANKGPRAKRHAVARCGNVGCTRCFPRPEVKRG